MVHDIKKNKHLSGYHIHTLSHAHILSLVLVNSAHITEFTIAKRINIVVHVFLKHLRGTFASFTSIFFTNLSSS